MKYRHTFLIKFHDNEYTESVITNSRVYPHGHPVIQRAERLGAKVEFAGTKKVGAAKGVTSSPMDEIKHALAFHRKTETNLSY